LQVWTPAVVVWLEVEQVTDSIKATRPSDLMMYHVQAVFQQSFLQSRS